MLLKGRLSFEKYIFLKAIFCPKIENVKLSGVSFERSILENFFFFNFRGGLLSSLMSNKPSKTLKIAILTSKTPKTIRSRYFSRNCCFEALRGVIGKKEESRHPLKLKNKLSSWWTPNGVITVSTTHKMFL